MICSKVAIVMCGQGYTRDWLKVVDRMVKRREVLTDNRYISPFIYTLCVFEHLLYRFDRLQFSALY